MDTGRRTFIGHLFRKIGLYLGLALLVPGTVAVSAAGPTPTPKPALSPEIGGKIIQEHLRILKSPTNPLETRKTMAGVIMELEVPGAREQLLKVLKDRTDKQAQLAVIEALADRTGEPFPEFRDPLVEILLLGDPDLQKSVTMALGQYRSQELTDRLIKIANDEKRPMPQRLGAIDALGKNRSVGTVQFLIKLMETCSASSAGTDRNEVKSACAKSLKEITRTDLGTNLGAWKAWWENNKNKTVAQWLDQQLTVVTKENRDLKVRLETTENALIDLTGKLFAFYSSSDESEQVKFIQANLSSPIPSQRRAGLEIITAFILPKKTIPAPLQPLIRDLVDDADPQVRKTCAKVLGESGDHQGMEALLKQMNAETDPGVKETLLVAVGQLGDPKYLDEFLQHLNSQVEQVSMGAAQGIAKLQKKLSSGQRDRTVQALIKRYRQAAEAQVQLKQELLAAMIVFQDYQFSQLFQNELKSPNTDIRIYAVKGLAALRIRDDRVLELMINQLNDTDPEVRKEVAWGIAALSQNSDSHAAVDQLLSRINPNIENDDQVRQKTWDAILVMVRRWPFDQQLKWARGLTLANEPSSPDRMGALGEMLSGQVAELSTAWTPEQKIGFLRELGRFMIHTRNPRSADAAVDLFRQAIATAKQLAPDKALALANQSLDDLLRISDAGGQVSLFLNRLPGLLEPGQVEAVLDRFLDWAQPSPNTNAAGRICKGLSKDLLGGVAERYQTQLKDLAGKYIPESKPATGAAAPKLP